MSEFREFRPPNPLGAIHQNGGMMVSEALAAANAVMKDMRKPTLRAIDRALAEIDKRFGPKAAKRDSQSLHDLYELSARIIDISGPVADLEIDRAAFSLCELVDRCTGVGQPDWPSIDVHLDALHLLRGEGAQLKAAERKVILKGLDRVTERLPIPDAPESLL